MSQASRIPAVRIPLLERLAAARSAAWMAEVVGIIALLAVAAALRLPNLDAYTGKFDEGIRAVQLMLMSYGFRPVRDIFASQGPLSLDLFYPFWATSGGTLGGARLAVVVYSLTAIISAGFLSRAVGGPLAGLATGGLLAVSPTFLKNSRLALVEIPALVPALLALLAVVRFRQSGSRRMLAAGAFLLALALTIKPMVAPAIVPFGLLLLLRRRSFRGLAVDLAVAASVGGATLLAVVFAAGPQQLYQQVVGYRLGSMAAERWSLGENWRLLADELIWEQPGFYLLAAIGAGLLLARKPAIGLAVLGWLAASLWLLLTYVPLQIKHAAILLPPLALLAGLSLGLGLAQGRRLSAGHLRSLLALGLGAASAAYLISLPNIAAKNRQTINVAGEGRAELYPEETALIQRLTATNEFILVDDPFLAYSARRLVPPALADPSYYRIRSGSLSPQEVIDSVSRFDVKLFFLFTDGLRELRRFAEWTDERYQVVSIAERRNGKDRSLYLRRDSDLSAAQRVLRLQLDEPLAIEYGGLMRLSGFALDRREVRAGGELELMLEWESLAPMPTDYRMVTVLRGPDGQTAEQSERSLSGGAQGTSRWQPGHWVFRTSTLDVRRSRVPGEYALYVGLYDSRARRLAPVTSSGPVGAEPGEALVTTIQVR